MLTAEEINTLIAAIVAIIGVLVAWFKTKEKNTAIAALTPGTVESKTPAVIATLPERSWKMSPATLRWLTFDATPENKKTIEDQITAAEGQQLTSYQIHFNGGYYDIEYGLLRGSAGNPSGK
jgi:hypothetical protein